MGNPFFSSFLKFKKIWVWAKLKLLFTWLEIFWQKISKIRHLILNCNVHSSRKLHPFHRAFLFHLCQTLPHRSESLYLTESIFADVVLSDLVVVQVLCFQSPSLVMVIPALLHIFDSTATLTQLHPVVWSLQKYLHPFYDAMTTESWSVVKSRSLSCFEVPFQFFFDTTREQDRLLHSFNKTKMHLQNLEQNAARIDIHKSVFIEQFKSLQSEARAVKNERGSLEPIVKHQASVSSTYRKRRNGSSTDEDIALYYPSDAAMVLSKISAFCFKNVWRYGLSLLLQYGDGSVLPTLLRILDSSLSCSP